VVDEEEEFAMGEEALLDRLTVLNGRKVCRGSSLVYHNGS